MVDGPGEFDPQRTRHEAGVYFSRCAIARPDRLSSTKVIRNQSKLYEGEFEVVDDFLGGDVGYDLKKMAPDTFIFPVRKRGSRPRNHEGPQPDPARHDTHEEHSRRALL